jgi:transposase
MSGKFQPINRDTAYLLPPSLQDWLPEKHLARFVVDIVDQLDVSELVKRYGGGGKEPYHPALLLALLFYGYATGVFSSRKLEQATHDCVAFRFITADAHPDHDTIATFRKRFLAELEGREPKPPEAGPRDKDQVNFTDEESRIMPSSEGFVQGYNAQAAVDIDSHLIVQNHITQQSNDKQEVEPTLKGLKQAEAHLGKAEGLLADAGYFSADNVKQCEAAKVTPYISDHRERHNLPWDERFKTPPPCPQDADAVTAMAHRLRTAEGKAIYAKRKSTVETVFGIIKEVMGFRRFHLRGLDAAQGEWNLVCMAWNLKRMHALAG